MSYTAVLKTKVKVLCHLYVVILIERLILECQVLEDVLIDFFL